jgi:hypothetical protein
MTTPEDRPYNAEPQAGGQPYHAEQPMIGLPYSNMEPPVAGMPYNVQPPPADAAPYYPPAPPAPQYQQSYPPPPYPYPYPYPPQQTTNGMAIASMVLGILWLYWIGSILALIFGYVARDQIRRNGQAGDGMAIAGIVLGWVGIGVLTAGLVIGFAVAGSSYWW